MLAGTTVAVIAQNLELVHAERRFRSRIIEYDERLVEILLGGDRLHELDIFPDEVVGIIAKHLFGALVEEGGDPILRAVEILGPRVVRRGLDARRHGRRAQAAEDALLVGREMFVGNMGGI